MTPERIPFLLRYREEIPRGVEHGSLLYAPDRQVSGFSVKGRWFDALDILSHDAAATRVTEVKKETTDD